MITEEFKVMGDFICGNKYSAKYSECILTLRWADKRNGYGCLVTFAGSMAVIIDKWGVHEMLFVGPNGLDDLRNAIDEHFEKHVCPNPYAEMSERD